MNSREPNPWQVLSSAPIYENPWISLVEHQVLNPAGKDGIYGVVHFKNRALGVLALDEANRLVLVGQYRFALGAYSWEIPEGGGSLTKLPLEEAKRELLEETGLKAKNWSQLLTMHLSNSVSDEIAMIFLARGLEQHAPMPEETEVLQVKKVSMSEACRMVYQGEITDSMSVAGILRLQILLETEKQNT